MTFTGGVTFVTMDIRFGVALLLVGLVVAQDTTISRIKQLDPKYRPLWPRKCSFSYK